MKKSQRRGKYKQTSKQGKQENIQHFMATACTGFPQELYKKKKETIYRNVGTKLFWF